MPISQDENELLTRTGPQTAMGDLLRSYWIPVLLADELAEPGSPPVRVRLLGESLVAFKDADGRVGLLQEACAHRRASLFFGRNEGRESSDGTVGLRCCYHGWKYDVHGHCIDMPNEPAKSRFKDHIQLTAYPAVQLGSVIWTYMGPPDTQPAPPNLEWAVVPESHSFISKRLQSCNFLQSMEGGIDSSHASFLHGDAYLWNPKWTEERGSDHVYEDTAPRFFIEPTEYGLLIGARRNVAGGRYYWRITQWVMPWYTFIPRETADSSIGAHAWVPIDDYQCWAWSITYHPDRPLTRTELALYQHGGGLHAKTIPGTFLPVQNCENDYLVDRTLQRAASWTGIAGISAQDAAMQESMGRIVDRTREHLGSSDAAIIAARRRLLGEARGYANGESSPSGRDPQSQRVRSTSAVLDTGLSWLEATSDSRRAAVEHYAGT